MPIGVGSIGRFTHPPPSHQEFLFYYEKENGIKSQMVERMKSGPRTYADPFIPLLPLIICRPRTRTQLVKQTYSVNVHSPNSPDVKKWHLSEYSFPLGRRSGIGAFANPNPSDAYYCADEVEELATVDDIQVLKDLPVPHELYTCARTSRAREAAIRSHNNPGMRASREPPRDAPQFPYLPRSEDIEQRSSSGSDSSGRGRSSSPEASLAPLEFLESLPHSWRHPMDDHALRLLDSAPARDA